jgi:hypothetical protein
MPDGMGNVVKTYGKDDYEGITAYEDGLYYNGKYYYIPTIDLIMDGENEEILAKYEGKYVNVNYNRHSAAVKKENGEWSSMCFSVCMPYQYELSKNNKNVRLFYLSHISKNGKEFVFTNEIGTLMHAGYPYLVVVDKDTLTYEAKNVKISTETQMVPINIKDGEQMGWWTGTFRNLNGTDLSEKNGYIIQTNGTYKAITQPSSKIWLGCFRSFFYAIDKPNDNSSYKMSFQMQTAGDDDHNLTAFPALNFEGDGDTDGIIIHTIDAEGVHHYYDMQGRLLDGKPAKGAYIYNGNKYMNK